MAGQAKVNVDEALLSAYSPEELHAALGSLQVIDAREASEFEKGTVRGAHRLGKSDLMFHPDEEWIKALVRSLVDSTDSICVLSGEGMVGQNTSRDLFVIWYLHESGVPLTRMGRLIGGFRAWSAANLPLELVRPPGVADVDELLQSAQVPEAVGQQLAAAGTSLQTLLALHASKGRAGVLAHCTSIGVATLKDRQAIANAVGRTSRAQAQ